MYHVKVAAIRRIITNIISYTHADNLTLIFCLPVIHNLRYLFTFYKAKNIVP